MSSCHGSAQEKNFTGDSRILLMGKIPPGVVNLERELIHNERSV